MTPPNIVDLPASRAIDAYIEGRKAATCYQVGFSPKPNRTPLIGSEGFLTLANGAVLTEISLELYFLVAAPDFDWIDAAFKQKSVKFATNIGGSFYPLVCGITDLGVDSDKEKGIVKCSVKLMGGKAIAQIFGQAA